jgi:hypothetical protein
MDHLVLAVSITVLAAEVMTEGVIAEIEDVQVCIVLTVNL